MRAKIFLATLAGLLAVNLCLGILPIYLVDGELFEGSRRIVLYSFTILGFVTWNVFVSVARNWLFLPVMLPFIGLGCWVGFFLDPPNYSMRAHFVLSTILVTSLGAIGWLTHWGWKMMSIDGE